MRAKLIFLLLTASVVLGQTVNMGRTYVASQNVRYANEGGTGTTLNKLAKLTGAPSTAIIAAITDTQGIAGIVVAGAGTTGSADIAFAGKASCVFDSATTAGHYVKNDASTAGDCEDAGATYPTSGQVIGIVTSTNGGAGTYEVDLTLRQPQAGGAGGGGALTFGAFASLPGTCAVGDHYLATDSFYDSWCTTLDTWSYFVAGRNVSRPLLTDFAWVNQGAATAVETYGGIYMYIPSVGTDQVRILKRAIPGATWTATVMLSPQLFLSAYPSMGLTFRQSSDGKLARCALQVENGGYWRLTSEKMNDPTSYSGAYLNSSGLAIFTPNAFPIWLRIKDDGVNRLCQYSLNGIAFITFHSVGRTDFLTADEVAIDANATISTGDQYAWFLGYSQTSP